MSTVARAAVANGHGSFTIEELEIGSPGHGEVLVEVRAAGVCHTDFDSMSWARPVVMGHEGAGVVEAVGEGVGSVAPGDSVLLNWAMPCGRCSQCDRGNQNICENHSPVTRQRPDGGHAHAEATTWNGTPIERSFNLGTLSTHTIVIEGAVLPLPKTIPFSSACILGCGVMTGYGSVVNAANVKAGSSVTVLGCGGVGLNVIQAARIAGAGRIVAVDVNPQRLGYAREFGATDVLQASREDHGLIDAAAAVRNVLNSSGADYAFECTGIPALGAAPLAFVRNAGVAVQVSGIEESILFNAELFEWDKTYVNPLYGKCRPAIDFPRLYNLYERGQLLLDQQVTQTYSLDNLQQAFDDMFAGRNAKGVILFED